MRFKRLLLLVLFFLMPSQFWSTSNGDMDKFQLTFCWMAVGVHVERKRNQEFSTSLNRWQCTQTRCLNVRPFHSKSLPHRIKFEESQMNANSMDKYYSINIDFTLFYSCRPFGLKRVILGAAFALNVVEKFWTVKLTSFRHVVKSETKLRTHSLKTGVLFIHKKLFVEDRKKTFYAKRENRHGSTKVMRRWIYKIFFWN